MSLPTRALATDEPGVKGRAQPEREPQRQRSPAATLDVGRGSVATAASRRAPSWTNPEAQPSRGTGLRGSLSPATEEVNGHYGPRENPEGP